MSSKIALFWPIQAAWTPLSPSDGSESRPAAKSWPSPSTSARGGEDLEVIRQRALDCGAVEAYVADARDEFASEYCMPALKANALYEGKYPLVSALSRPVITKHLVKAAREFGATTVAHGCTGKGNDQVRFEVSITSMAPDMDCISPVRDLALTRDVAIEYAEKHNLPIETTKHKPLLD